MINKTYGGYAYFPQHPLADMHGMIRFCIMSTSPLRVRDSLSKYGVNLFSIHSHYWGESQSHVEQEVSRYNFGEVYFCRPQQAYLAADLYVHDNNLKTAFREESQRVAHESGSQVKASGPNKRKVEFP